MAAGSTRPKLTGRNARVVLSNLIQEVRRQTSLITTAADIYSGRDRAPEDMLENRASLLVQQRERMIVISQRLVEADIVVRYRLAELGCDPLGVTVGRTDAMARLTPETRDRARVLLGIPHPNGGSAGA